MWISTSILQYIWCVLHGVTLTTMTVPTQATDGVNIDGAGESGEWIERGDQKHEKIG